MSTRSEHFFGEARRESKRLETMPKRGYPMIGTMTCRPPYHFVVNTARNGVCVTINGRILDLDMAPKDENGTVELLEVREDNMVWASGTLYLDPATGLYFPDQDKSAKGKGKARVMKRSAGIDESKSKGEEKSFKKPKRKKNILVEPKVILSCMEHLERVRSDLDGNMDSTTRNTILSCMEHLERVRSDLDGNMFKTIEGERNRPCEGCENLARIADDRDRMAGQAISVAKRYGQIDCIHKSWVIDQMVRALWGDNEEAYKAWVNCYEYITNSDGEEEEVDKWDTGIAP